MLQIGNTLLKLQRRFSLKQLCAIQRIIPSDIRELFNHLLLSLS